jgi:hypothetical protein
MLPILVAAAGVSWLVKAAFADARTEREVTAQLQRELEETLETLEDCVGKHITVLDADGNERSNYAGRVHRVIHTKGLVILDVSRPQRKHANAGPSRKEFKTWRVMLNESFVELD